MAPADNDEKRLLGFIGDLYDAAADASQWQSLATTCGRLFDSESCVFLVADTKTGVTRSLDVTDNFNGPFWSGYQAHYWQDDQWVTGGIARPGRALMGHEVAPEEWFRKSHFINELCVSAGAYYLLGAVLPVGENKIGVVGIHRPQERPNFEEEERSRLAPLVPHLVRAVQLTSRLSEAKLGRYAALDGLERTGSATIVVDGNGLILFANGLAERLLRHGVGLCAMNGRLAGKDRLVAGRLAFLVRGAAGTAAGSAAGTPGGALAIERGENRLPLTVLVAPFRPQGEGFGAPIPAALVFIRDPELPTLETGILQDLFGLTPAQAVVAARVADGESLERVAGTLRISLHTARDHLKAVFVKTGTSRQSQLVALLMRTVATLGN